MKINLRGRATEDTGEPKPTELRIRFTEQERPELDKAAGEDTSTWARELLLKAAHKRR